MAKKKKKSKEKSSGKVAVASDAMDLQKQVPRSGDPRRTAQAPKHSEEPGGKPKAGPMRAALSMLTVYFERAGRNLPWRRKKTPRAN